jgi:hypothetical protein
MDKVHPLPQNLAAWQQAAREQQVVYAEWLAMMGPDPGRPQDQCQRWQNALNQRGRRRDPDMMDVDAIEINTLTKEEKDKCMKKGQCFYCKGTGHISCNCPKKKGKQQGNLGGRPQQMQQ